MKKRSIILIIGLMTFALLGVLGMQWYFISQSYQLKSQLFDQSVNESLNNVVKKLEKQDAVNFLIKKAIDTPKIKKKSVYRLVKNTSRKTENFAAYLSKQQKKADSLFLVRDSLLRSRYPLVLSYDEDNDEQDALNMDAQMQVEVRQYMDAFGRLHQQTFAYPAPRALAGKAKKIKKQDSVKKYVVFDPQTGPRLVTLAKPQLSNIAKPENMGPDKKQKEIVKEYLDSVQEHKKNVIQDLATEFKQTAIPLKNRIQPQLLDSILKSELKNKGIDEEFAYQVSLNNTDSVIFRQASNKAQFVPENSYRTQLFPKDVLREAGWLTLSFPNKNKYILSNMTFIMGLSGGLLLVILFSFGYTLQMIIKQKKISEMKTDFINNMTHEFKTPVATIMIASEALKDKDIIKDKSRLNRLASIIYDENVRLGNHIERVLHIAKIDKEELRIEQKEVEVNVLLAAVADSMLLQLQKHGGEIKLDLNAAKDLVIGDELHLSNVIFNLLDNAIKYCEQSPLIELSTYNSGNNLLIKVKDNGIGMNRDQLSRIFDQFYRIPTGNLHDVKGFGLGLSYVNTIVKHMKGQIKVKSEKGKGSEFEINLPLI